MFAVCFGVQWSSGAFGVLGFLDSQAPWGWTWTWGLVRHLPLAGESVLFRSRHSALRTTSDRFENSIKPGFTTFPEYVNTRFRAFREFKSPGIPCDISPSEFLLSSLIYINFIFIFFKVYVCEVSAQ